MADAEVNHGSGFLAADVTSRLINCSSERPLSSELGAAGAWLVCSDGKSTPRRSCPPASPQRMTAIIISFPDTEWCELNESCLNWSVPTPIDANMGSMPYV